MKWLFGLLVSLSVFGIHCICGCYSEKEIEQSEDVPSWKQSCKSVRTCEWNGLLFARGNCSTSTSLPNAPRAPQMPCVSRAVGLRMIFSVGDCGGFGCWDPRVALEWFPPQAETLDLRIIVSRDVTVISLSVRWKLGRRFTRIISDFIWQQGFVGIGGNPCGSCLPEKRWHLPIL